MPNRFDCYARANNDECFDKIQELRRFYTDGKLAALLGIKRYAISRREQPIPVVRLAYLLHRITFNPKPPLRMIELLCLGKYGTAPPQAALPAPAPA